MAKPKGPPAPHRKAEMALMLWLHAQMPKQDIAEYLDVAPQTISNWAKRYEWDRRKQEWLLAPDNMKQQLYKEGIRVLNGQAPSFDPRALKTILDMIERLESKVNIYIAVPLFKQFNDYCRAQGAPQEVMEAMTRYQKHFTLALAGEKT